MKEGKEKKKWNDVTIDHMSDESSGDDIDKIVVHHPQWRSSG